MSIISGNEIKVWPTKSFIQTVFESYKKHGNSVFMEEIQSKRSYTFEELRQKTNKIAATLISLGIGPGHIVTFLAGNSYESFSFVYGVILCGATICPINADLREIEVSKMLDVMHPSLIMCESDKYVPMINEAVKMSTVKTRVMTHESFKSYLVSDNEANKFQPPTVNSAKHVYLILFTSGTTGVPKAVKLKDRATLMLCELVHWAHGRFLLTSPLFWISNSILLAKAMIAGFTIVNPDNLDPKNVLRIMQDYQITSWFGSPSLLLEICNVKNVKKYDLSNIENVFTGGSHVLIQQKHMIRNTLFNGRKIMRMIYGSTEAGVITEWPESVDPDAPEYDSIGKPVAGVKIKIKDLNSDRILGPGDIGEICIQSVHFMAGYMNKDLAGQELDENGWWHMGDIGYLDKNGYVYYVSRLKDIFKFRGIQIAPSELEEILLQHPLISEAAVVGKPHEIDGEWPTAFIVPKPNAKLTEKEVEEFLEARVPDSKRLRGGVHFMDSLPRSAVGKVLTTNLLKLLE